MIKHGKEKFQEYVPVLKREYDRWRIKREFREHNPIYTELLNIKDEIAALENRPELAYEEKLRLDAILRNRFSTLRAQLPTRDPFALPAAASETKANGMSSSITPGYGGPVSSPVWTTEGDTTDIEPRTAAPRPVAVTAVEAEELLSEPPPLGQPERPEVAAAPALSFADKLGSPAHVNIPATAHSAYNELVHLISAKPGHIDVDRKNQLVIEGKTLKKSNARELFQSLYWRIPSQNKTGRLALFGALAEIGAPASLILDPAAQRDYSRVTHIEPSPLRTRSQPAAATSSRTSDLPPATPQKGKGRKRTAPPLLSVLGPHSVKRARPPGTRVRVLRLYR